MKVINHSGRSPGAVVPNGRTQDVAAAATSATASIAGEHAAVMSHMTAHIKRHARSGAHLH